MFDADYEALGFICGVEIHQQLQTDKKLFCRCPNRHYVTKTDAEVLRHMRPTLSELGEYDRTALMEFKTKKEIVYLLNNECVCTYEMDDTPPFLINDQGLDTAVEVALLLNLSLVDELHIARKQYLDGSIPTGFQRTAIVGVDGWIPYKNRKIRIQQLGYEEDSSREVSNKGHLITFRTDRLGTPLIEPVTYPDMRTPIEAMEVTELIARLMRTTGKVARGIGATRQDVNVSITGGQRVEIKGVPQIWRIPLLVHNEAFRQKAFLDIRAMQLKEGLTQDNLVTVDKDVTEFFARTHAPLIRSGIAAGGSVRGIKVVNFRKAIDFPTQPHQNFFSEIKGRIRIIACIDQPPIAIRLVEFEKYGLSLDERLALNKMFEVGPNDELILVWGPKEDTITATKEIRIRCVEALLDIPVPPETRKHLEDGTTTFERILPGADRMYPDTDLPPIQVGATRIERIRKQLPEPIWERDARYTKMKLPVDVRTPLAITPPHAELFDRAVKELDVPPIVAGETLVPHLKRFRREGYKTDRLDINVLYKLFEAFSKKRFTREGIPAVMRNLLEQKPPLDVDRAVKELKFHPMEIQEIEEYLTKNILPDLSKSSLTKDEKKFHEYVMGRAMKQARGCIPGAQVSKLVKSLYKKFSKGAM